MTTAELVTVQQEHDEQAEFYNNCMDYLYKIGLFSIASGHKDFKERIIISASQLEATQGTHGTLYPPKMADVESLIERITSISQSDALNLLNVDIDVHLDHDRIQPPQKVVAKKFPTEIFPMPIKQFIDEGASAINCPPDFIGIALLTFAGTAIGNSRIIQVKKSWKESPRLFSAIVAEPGSKKSPALDLVSKPFKEEQRKLHDQYKMNYEQYEIEQAKYEKELALWKKDQSDIMPEKPEEPKFKQLYTTDATTEALAELLSSNPRGLVLIKDELNAWVQSMNQYRGGKGADKENWLSFWNGAQAVVNRKNRKEPLVIDNPFVNIIGAIPPDVLPELTDEQGREDGFLNRILFAYPEPVPIRWTEDEVSDDSMKNLKFLFHKLWNLEPDADGPKVVSFSNMGKQAWVDWINSHHKELENPKFPNPLRPFWAKLEGYAARLALIIHLMRYSCDETEEEQVDEISMAATWLLVDYFKSHIKKVNDKLYNTQEDKRVDDAVEWIRKNGGKASKRDMVTYKVARCKKASEAEELFNELFQRGFGEIQKVSKGRGRPSIVFRLY